MAGDYSVVIEFSVKEKNEPPAPKLPEDFLVYFCSLSAFHKTSHCLHKLSSPAVFQWYKRIGLFVRKKNRQKISSSNELTPCFSCTWRGVWILQGQKINMLRKIEFPVF